METQEIKEKARHTRETAREIYAGWHSMHNWLSPFNNHCHKKGTMLDLKRITEYNQMQYVVLDLNTGLDKPSM